MQGSGRTISLAPSVGSSLPSPPLLAWQFPHRTTFFGAFSATRDSLIKVGSLIAGIGLGFYILISILQMAGVYVFVLALLGALVMMAGVVIACIKFNHALPERRFCRGVLRVYFPGASAVFILDVGKPDKRRWAGWPADLFLRPQYHLLDSFSHSGCFLVYRGYTVWAAV